MSEAWEDLITFEDIASAEALAELLRKEGVPTEVITQSPVPGLVENVRVVVPSSLAHRARWILKSFEVTDAELTFAATGELPTSDENSG